MRETAERFPWDKASPGNTCLETGMQRLLRGEVSRAANKHACAVLLDLQTFYDSVNWTKLEERIVATGFPPAIALLVMQVYRGTRYLVAEDLLSEGILPARGILAGCPFATMMARVYLQPIMQEAAQLRSITALDTWVDDIGADFEARYPEQAAFAVYEGYKTLRRLLEGSDLRLSLKKTGFLCTTAEARRELQKLRKDGDPAICDSMKDLGLDCALGRVRRVKVQRARRHKAGKRQKKLKQLRVPSVPAKVRLFRGGVASVLASPSPGHATHPATKAPDSPGGTVWQTKDGQSGGGPVLRGG